ncbi:MAG: hypothetical protein JWL66_1008 [Sphingomonadales bacterium]|nr:hypothetical protein [Sphingomonadales bacterium]
MLLLLADAPVHAAPAIIQSRVTDGAHLLSINQATEISGLLEKLELTTHHQFVVATTASLNGRPIEAYSLDLANRSGIGRKGFNDGVMLLVAPNERKVRIEVGYGLAKALRDDEAKAIIDLDILPSFKSGNFPRGIRAGVIAISHEIGMPDQGSIK